MIFSLNFCSICEGLPVLIIELKAEKYSVNAEDFLRGNISIVLCIGRLEKTQGAGERKILICQNLLNMIKIGMLEHVKYDEQY